MRQMIVNWFYLGEAGELSGRGVRGTPCPIQRGNWFIELRLLTVKIAIQMVKLRFCACLFALALNFVELVRKNENCEAAAVKRGNNTRLD